jgi:hypothetical protein
MDVFRLLQIAQQNVDHSFAGSPAATK